MIKVPPNANKNRTVLRDRCKGNTSIFKIVVDLIIKKNFSMFFEAFEFILIFPTRRTRRKTNFKTVKAKDSRHRHKITTVSDRSLHTSPEYLGRSNKT